MNKFNKNNKRILIKEQWLKQCIRKILIYLWNINSSIISQEIFLLEFTKKVNMIVHHLKEHILWICRS